jgi:putative RNA 2'-phosphotransferase
MTISLTEVSRAVAHALRHEPWLYELELDDEGWTDVDALLEALRGQRPAWRGVDRSVLRRMIDSSSKRRYELAGERIRALYGHSLPGRIRKEAADPPDILFHGTAPEPASVILVTGLVPMRRQYVHLSSDRRTASEVGGRKCQKPVILTVDAAAAARNGVTFLRGNEKVWLAVRVPPEFIAVDG